MSSGRRERGVRALSALQHVFLVVVAILLGASTARAYGYEPACAAAYSSSTDVVKANVLQGTHAFTANNVLYARLDIAYNLNATGTGWAPLFVWGGDPSTSSCGAWQGGFKPNHMMFMGVQCNAGGSDFSVEFDPYLNAGGRYVLEYYYDSQARNARMYKTCMGSCDANETFNTTVEVTPAGGAVVNLFITDGELSVGYGRHNDSPDTDFTGTHYSAAFYDCPRVYGYEPTCAASYSSSTDVVKANVLPGTHAFTANNVLYARLDITYYATGTDTSSLFVWGGSGVYSCGAWGAWRGGFLSTHIMFMDVTCNNGGSIRVEFDPYLNAGGRYILEYALELNYYDSQTSNARMYKTCMGLCGVNETLGVIVELTPAGGVAVNMFMSDGQISVGHEDHSVNPPSPDSDFTGTFHSAAFYDCPPSPPCDINEHVASNVCTACVGGSTNPAGDNPGGADTTCGCSTNTSVVYNVCTACVGGSTNPAGDDPYGADTNCGCSTNEHVASNVCTACVGGSTNPAGDDPYGADTTCGCSTNTSVISNVCTACGHGGSADAGHAVPGQDTQCIYYTGLEALKVHLVADDVADNTYGSWDDRVETLSFTPPGLEDCKFCSGNALSLAPTLVNNAFNGHKAMRFGFGDYTKYAVTGTTGLMAPNGSQTVFHTHPTQASVTVFVVFRPMAHTPATEYNLVYD